MTGEEDCVTCDKCSGVLGVLEVLKLEIAVLLGDSEWS